MTLSLLGMVEVMSHLSTELWLVYEHKCSWVEKILTTEEVKCYTNTIEKSDPVSPMRPIVLQPLIPAIAKST